MEERKHSQNFQELLASHQMPFSKYIDICTDILEDEEILWTNTPWDMQTYISDTETPEQQKRRKRSLTKTHSGTSQSCNSMSASSSTEASQEPELDWSSHDAALEIHFEMNPGSRHSIKPDMNVGCPWKKESYSIQQHRRRSRTAGCFFSDRCVFGCDRRQGKTFHNQAQLENQQCQNFGPEKIKTVETSELVSQLAFVRSV